MSFSKLAAQVPAVLAETSNHLRKVAHENVALSEENDALRYELRLMKIARRMEQRGLEPHRDFEQKVAGLREIEQEKLASLEQAIEMSAGGFKLGHLEQKEDEHSANGGELYNPGGADPLNDFILSGSAYNS